MCLWCIVLKYSIYGEGKETSGNIKAKMLSLSGKMIASFVFFIVFSVFQISNNELNVGLYS